MNYLEITYGIYLFVSISLTVWVGKTLFKHGSVFLIEIFHGNLELAHAVNKLLLVGFYLMNMGYAVVTLETYHSVQSPTDVIERLGTKIGGIILILGSMHFFNLLILFNLRRKAKGQRFPIVNAE